MAVEGDAAGSGFDEAQNHSPQRGLAASGFADQAERFSLLDIERDAVNGANLTLRFAEDAFVGLVDLDQIADGEQGHGMNIKQKSTFISSLHGCALASDHASAAQNSPPQSGAEMFFRPLRMS